MKHTMTEAQIKEQVSKHFIGAMASYFGYIVENNMMDFGVDLTIQQVGQWKINKRRRYFSHGIPIDFQLKCTSNNTLIQNSEHVTFDLDVKNYNDLIVRNSRLSKGLMGLYAPLVLILIILPQSKKDWIIVDKEGMKLLGNAYWFYPLKNKKMSKNKYTERIKIPIENKVNLDFLSEIFNLFGK